jgi:hypothetical protein
MVLVAFICFFLLVAAWLKAPSKAPATVEAPTPAMAPGVATA